MPSTHLQFVVRCLRDALSTLTPNDQAHLDIQCAAGALFAHLTEIQTIADEKALDGVLKDLSVLAGADETLEGCEQPYPEVKVLRSTSSSK